MSTARRAYVAWVSVNENDPNRALHVYHDHPDCWARHEPYNCTCPDSGSLHYLTIRGVNRPCSELAKFGATEPTNPLARAAWVALKCLTCGLELSEQDPSPAPADGGAK